eukprot:TRINITY_DN26501_c0_g2_i3.p1 TRINITY_DN26501_c0_g2~~TRINITY_DN26501_c0_g2_i3.p1  ORF type:complete len:425 (-),score=83.09 TRINITY_DN26501_c0_g2_i3:175-1449(-)
MRDPLCWVGLDFVTFFLHCCDVYRFGLDFNPECFSDNYYTGKRCCAEVVALNGDPLPLGAPSAAAGGGALREELVSESASHGTWVAKNTTNMPTFIEAHAKFVEDDALFEKFRTNRDISDGFYSVLDVDSQQMLNLMRSSDYGRALLASVYPRVSGKIDGFGSPAIFEFESVGAMSADLFNMLFKLMLILRSVNEFAPVPDQTAPPSVADVERGLLGAALFSDWDIVEVGGGPGLHAATLVAALGARSYSLLDLPTQQHLQHKVLARALGQETVDRTFAFPPCCTRPMSSGYVLQAYDLFISTYAFSELSREMRSHYFYTFIVQSKRGFIIDNYEDIHESRRELDKGIEHSVDRTTDGGDGGSFTGLDLVWRLQDLGFDARIITKQQVLQQALHRSRTVVITWASTGVDPAARHDMSNAARMQR